jgi:hypothetical protein
MEMVTLSTTYQQRLFHTSSRQLSIRQRIQMQLKLLLLTLVLGLQAEEPPAGLSKKCLLNPSCVTLAAHCDGALKRWLYDRLEPTQEQANCMCSPEFHNKLKSCSDGSWVTPSCPEAKQAINWKQSECARVLSGERKFVPEKEL